MQLRLSLKEKDVAIVLLDGDKIISEKQWVDENDLLEKFFPAFEDMLTDNNYVIEDVDEFTLNANIPSGYTTARIARTIVKTLKFAQKR